MRKEIDFCYIEKQSDGSKKAICVYKDGSKKERYVKQTPAQSFKFKRLNDKTT